MATRKKAGKAAKSKSKSKSKSTARTMTKAKAKTKAKSKAKGKSGTAAEKRFVEGLVTRGQAVEKTSAGQKLPPGATHWLVVDKETGARTVVRGRFSLV